MDKIFKTLLPKAEIDDKLFDLAPSETLRVAMARLNSRILRMEVLLLISILSGFAPELVPKILETL